MVVMVVLVVVCEGVLIRGLHEIMSIGCIKRELRGNAVIILTDALVHNPSNWACNDVTNAGDSTLHPSTD